ncbi:hypothetical protein L195_g035693 [Trifolium pratense]|uniref:Putative plant transposon protein domain-containing protein n=1 Tax=Trifolium pratense TaxID=57577 RepID=A0A2K3LMF2_TRIPR|nr:hypothetical protein L195_g035693 [Trifolium pratense]
MPVGRQNIFLSPTCAEHFNLIEEKGVIQERSINFPDITFLPEMETTARHYSWIYFNSLIGDCNISWVREFYADAVAYFEEDFTSAVRGVRVSYTPAVIDVVFGFAPPEHCWAHQWRHSAHTEDEYDQILHTLALPGRDWQYTSTCPPEYH